MGIEDELTNNGFLSDEEALAVTEHIRGNAITQCMWYMSKSLLDSPEMKSLCHDVCDGYGSGCQYVLYEPILIDIVDVSKGNYD
jgi:hypothetical protein